MSAPARITKKEASARIAKYGWCRAVNHFWVKDGPIKKVGKYVEIRLACEHCPKVRITRMTLRGETEKGRHLYRNTPKDYSTPGHRVDKSAARVIVFLGGK